MTRPSMARVMHACPEIADRLRDTTCCIIYDGPRDSDGYGLFSPPDGGSQRVHRFVYKRLFGDPGPLTVDHLCYVPSCLEPEHMEAVPQEENTRRAVARRRLLAATPGGVATPACCQNVAGVGPVNRPKPLSAAHQRREQKRLQAERHAAYWQTSKWPVRNALEALGLPELLVVPNWPGQKPPMRIINLLAVTPSDLQLLTSRGARDQIRGLPEGP